MIRSIALALAVASFSTAFAQTSPNPASWMEVGESPGCVHDIDVRSYRVARVAGSPTGTVLFRSRCKGEAPFIQTVGVHLHECTALRGHVLDVGQGGTISDKFPFNLNKDVAEATGADTVAAYICSLAIINNNIPDPQK